MFLRDLFESTTGHRTLFRGDASKIEAFSTEKTRSSISLLFGMGIYLTDNPRIALDYTVKGGYRVDGSGTVLVRDQDTQEDAVRLYLNMIMARQLGWPQRRNELKEEWMQKWWGMQAGTRRPDAPRTWAKEEPSPEYLEYKAKEEAFNADFRIAMRKEMGLYLKRAKALYKKQEINVFQDTLGKWSLVSPSHEGYLTRFEIPESYCRATIHGDRPMTDKELKVLRDFVYAVVPNGRTDLRDKNNEFVASFDEWVEVFRREGTRYAWNDIMVGGNGENPSLDQFWNGTHGGYGLLSRHEKMDEFIAHLRANGYNGIEYDGGTRLGANIRGGGGIRHQSFVFWDDDFINSCRVENQRAEYPKLDQPLGSIRTNGFARKWVEPDKNGNMYSD